MMDMEDKYVEQALYNDGENFILKKKDVAFWLTYGALQCYVADEDLCFLANCLADNQRILEQIVNMDDEDLVGLSIHPMSDWHYLNMELVDEWKNGEL